MPEADMSYRDLPPVPPVEKPEAFRQTLLRYFEHCPRSGYLSLRTPETSAFPLDRGTALHLVAERLMRDLIAQGEERYAEAGATELSEMTGALVDEVLDEHPELSLRHIDADAVRAMAYHLAVGADVSPGSVLGIEREFATELEGEQVTATVDLVYEIDQDTLGIDDYKSSLGVPAQEEFSSHFYAFQLRFYAWIAMTTEMGSYSQVRARCVFPRYLDDDGKIRTRELVMDKQRVLEFGRDLARLMRRVQAGFEDLYELEAGGDVGPLRQKPLGQKWPAVPGDHCVYCPAEVDCPIPARYRRWQGAIQKPEHAAEALEWAEVMGRRVSKTKEEARAFIEKTGPLGAGGSVWDLIVSTTNALKKRKGRSDWEGMAEAVANGTFNREDWVKPQTATRLKRFSRVEWEKLNGTGWGDE